MKINKCKYYNNFQTACCLLLDDLVPVAVATREDIGPYNDWGYLMDSPNSLYTYIDKWLFQKFPEIRGTIFFPLESHHSISKADGCKIFVREIDTNYIEFMRRLELKFEFAFHGIKHSRLDIATNRTILEFSQVTNEYLESSVRKIMEFQQRSGFTFSGGKFPGYTYSKKALQLISMLNSKWWALNSNMIQTKSPENNMSYLKHNETVLIPSNISGDIFKQNKNKTMLRKVKFRLTTGYYEPKEFLYYLYENGFPITIQEHFQNQGNNSKRQTPNLYDDIQSLDHLFGILRKMNLWYTCCHDLAHYYDSYVQSKISIIDNNKFEVKYNGLWSHPFLSLVIDSPYLEKLNSNQFYVGLRKDYNSWIFNVNESGVYRRVFDGLQNRHN